MSRRVKVLPVTDRDDSRLFGTEVTAPVIQSFSADSVGSRSRAAARFLLRDRRIKGLITSRFEKYDQRYALDYCGNLADIVASRILVSYWRRPNSHCFGDRRDCGRNQARHGSRSVGVGLRQKLRVRA
jgi:hypothetical protein